MIDQRPDPPGPGSASSRRLAAVLHADVVGFSRLMAKDEGGTHARLMAHRDVLYAALRLHNGRVVGTAGDAVLAIFDSVVDALTSALIIQEKLSEANADLPQDERLEFRIGLNIGDIILDGDDIFGNGVNVAARTEALADPGGIAVSAAFKEQVGNRVQVTFQDRGLHAVKNIDVPLHVFAVFTEGHAPDRPTPVKPRRRITMPALIALAVCTIAVAAFFVNIDGSGDPAAQKDSDADVATALQKPAIVVLPFSSRDAAEDSYFGDGVTEDVIGSLGRFSDLLVLSWSAVSPYKDQPVEVTQLASDLGADYVVTGSIQRADAKIRITVQLSDASTGVLIWSERYNEQLTDLFEVQDRLVRQVVAALSVRVTLHEETRVASTPTESLGAYDLVLKGRDLLRQVARESNQAARDMFEKALAEDPEYADALVALANTHINDLAFGWTFRPEYSLATAVELANQAIKLDLFNSGAFALLASTQKYAGNLSEAERSIDRSLELNPNDAMSHAERCSILIFSGRPAEALKASDLALRIDPYPRGDPLNCPIGANLMLEQYEAALDVFDKFPDRTSEEPASLIFRAGAHAMLGQTEQAEKFKAKALARYPFVRAQSMAQIVGGEEYQQNVLKALQRAGFE
jgi:adenylate cyclase